MKDDHRALTDDKGKQVKKAGPSIPVEIMGLSDVPAAGDTLMVVSDERAAREAAAKRTTKRRDVRIAASSGQRVSLETFMAMPADGGQKALNLILKAEGQGSVEALRSRVESLSTPEVDIRVILAGVGGITPNDVNLASASNAVLIGFNIRPDESVKRQADSEQVDLRFYQVIYDVENDLKKAMVGMLAPKFREIILGRAFLEDVNSVPDARVVLARKANEVSACGHVWQINFPRLACDVRGPSLQEAQTGVEIHPDYGHADSCRRNMRLRCHTHVNAPASRQLHGHRPIGPGVQHEAPAAEQLASHSDSYTAGDDGNGLGWTLYFDAAHRRRHASAPDAPRRVVPPW